MPSVLCGRLGTRCSQVQLEERGPAPPGAGRERQDMRQGGVSGEEGAGGTGEGGGASGDGLRRAGTAKREGEAAAGLNVALV